MLFISDFTLSNIGWIIVNIGVFLGKVRLFVCFFWGGGVGRGFGGEGHQ